MMIAAEHVLNGSLTVATVLLTHATYRAVPAEHKALARHHARRVGRAIVAHVRWWALWLAWTVTTPFRGGMRRLRDAAIVTAFILAVLLVGWAMITPALSVDRSEWGNNCPLNG